MLIHAAQLKSSAPQECIKGKALTRTLVYKSASPPPPKKMPIAMCTLPNDYWLCRCIGACFGW